MAKASSQVHREGSESDPRSHDLMRAALEREFGEQEQGRCEPPSIPDHILLRRIGTGAYGDVWLARNALGTLRAVKIIYRNRFDEDRPYEREFKGILKYEPVSRSHQGLVHVLHVGRNDDGGCFYYVMELADNTEEEKAYAPRTLRAELRRRGRLPAAEAAQLCLELAAALGHLHKHGLIHRDIKPANVIFVGGRPKLADIGLVTGVGDSRSFVGTEGFIPPEGPGTQQADLYGLGKLLYEVATGRDRLEFPQLPAGVVKMPDGDALLELNEVMTRVCAPELASRYGNATELQADLNLFLAGRSLRRVRNIERHFAQMRRFAAIAAGFVLLAALTIWVTKRELRNTHEQARQANERAQVETKLRQRAESAEQEAQQQLYRALLGEAHGTVRSGELGHRVRALEAIRRAAAISNSVELRREALTALGLVDLQFEREFPITPEVTLCQIDPSFGRVAIGRGRSPVEIFSVAEGKRLMTLPSSNNLVVHVAKWSPDGRFLAVKRDLDGQGYRAQLELWDTTTGKQTLFLPDLRWNSILFHPTRPLVVIGRQGSVTTKYNLETGETEGSFRLTHGPSTKMEFSPLADRFFCVVRTNGGTQVVVHDTTTGSVLLNHFFPELVGEAAWQPGGEWIAVPEGGGSVYLLHAISGETRRLGQHKAQAVSAQFSPDGAYLITGGWERALVCWDMRTMERAFRINAESFRGCFSADGQHFAAETPTGVRSFKFLRPAGSMEFWENLGSRMQYAAFSPDGRWLAASADQRLAVWDLKQGGPAALEDEGAEARCFFTPDSSQLFASCRNDDAIQWSIQPGKVGDPPQLQRVYLAKPEGFTSLCLVSNWVVFTTLKGSQVVSLDGGQLNDKWIQTVEGISGASPDGRWLGIYRPFSHHLYVYRLPGLERVAKLEHPAKISQFHFAPTGNEVSIASRTRLDFWSTHSWQRVRELNDFNGVRYTPDSQTIWLRGEAGTAGMYKLEGLHLRAPLPAGFFPVAVSPDGRQLAVSLEARRLLLWNVGEIRKELAGLGLEWPN